MVVFVSAGSGSALRVSDHWKELSGGLFSRAVKAGAIHDFADQSCEQYHRAGKSDAMTIGCKNALFA
ncbi:hypothetical protein ABIC08_009242 [Bradyrhizobium sp. RT9b]|uniref:hypothetical protein n=1 Tax=Bradyrhizobium sp. RT9b TaxID=3156385 RepID=UPI003396EC53